MQCVTSLAEQRIAQQKFPLSESLSPNQKRHFTFWIKFGLSPKFGLSERLIQKVKPPSVYTYTRYTDASYCCKCLAHGVQDNNTNVLLPALSATTTTELSI